MQALFGAEEVVDVSLLEGCSQRQEAWGTLNFARGGVYARVKGLVPSARAVRLSNCRMANDGRGQFQTAAVPDSQLLPRFA